MGRIAVIARLKPDSEARAAELIAAGPPFDPAAVGLERHAVYLSHGEVVFVFEGPEVEWIVDGVVDDPFRSPVFAEWKTIVERSPKIAREAYSWDRDEIGEA
jgi:hypothetical protein